MSPLMGFMTPAAHKCTLKQRCFSLLILLLKGRKKALSLSPLSFSQTHTFSIHFQPTCNLGLNYIYPYSIYSQVKTPKCQKENRTPPLQHTCSKTKMHLLFFFFSTISARSLAINNLINVGWSRTLIPLSSCLLCCFSSRPRIPIRPVSKQGKKEESLQLLQAAIYSRNALINPLYSNCPVPSSRQPKR